MAGLLRELVPDVKPITILFVAYVIDLFLCTFGFPKD